jgi:hypothetical protein
MGPWRVGEECGVGVENSGQMQEGVVVVAAAVVVVVNGVAADMLGLEGSSDRSGSPTEALAGRHRAGA